MDTTDWAFRCSRAGCGFGCMAEQVMATHLLRHDEHDKEEERLRRWKQQHEQTGIPTSPAAR